MDLRVHAVCVAIRCINFILARDEGGVFHCDQIWIALEQIVHQRVEQVLVAARKVARSDLIGDVPQLDVALDVFRGE